MINIDNNYKKIEIEKANKYEVKSVPQEVEIESINRGMNFMGEYDIEICMLCPSCKEIVGDLEEEELYYQYCPNCGQKLKWS